MAQGPSSEPSLVHGPQTAFQSVVLGLVSWGEAIGATAGAIFGFVASQFPWASTDQITAGISLAEQQIEAGKAFGTPNVYTRPRLSDIPVCPGCPAGQIEVEIRIRVANMDANNPASVDGVVRAIFNHVPDAQELQELVDQFGDELAGFYSEWITPLTTWEVSSAQRGKFFGK